MRLAKSVSVSLGLIAATSATDAATIPIYFFLTNMKRI